MRNFDYNLPLEPEVEFEENCIACGEELEQAICPVCGYNNCMPERDPDEKHDNQ